MIKGNRLRELRKKKGLTQTQLGELLGLDETTVCCYEKETRNPALDTIIELMNIFAVSSDYLLGTDNIVTYTDKENEQKFTTMTKEEVAFINELKKNKMVYDILIPDPKRGMEIIKSEIG